MEKFVCVWRCRCVLIVLRTSVSVRRMFIWINLCWAFGAFWRWMHRGIETTSNAPGYLLRRQGEWYGAQRLMALQNGMSLLNPRPRRVPARISFEVAVCPWREAKWSHLLPPSTPPLLKISILREKNHVWNVRQHQKMWAISFTKHQGSLRPIWFWSSWLTHTKRRCSSSRLSLCFLSA